MLEATGGGIVSNRPRLAKQTTVAVCQGMLAIEPLIVHEQDLAAAVMRRSAAQPETRLVGVVDEDGILTGVIPILRLAEGVIARVVPESLMGDITGIADVARFGHAVEARTAKEAMIPPASIAPEATIGDAFKKMHHERLSGLYVVDPAGRPTGYLDLLELAIRYLDALEADPTDAAE